MESLKLTSAEHHCPECGHDLHGATYIKVSEKLLSWPRPHRADCPVRARIAYHEQTGLSLRTATALALIETDHG